MKIFAVRKFYQLPLPVKYVQTYCTWLLRTQLPGDFCYHEMSLYCIRQSCHNVWHYSCWRQSVTKTHIMRSVLVCDTLHRHIIYARSSHTNCVFHFPYFYTYIRYWTPQLLAEVSIKQCDADYTFAEEEDIMSKNRYRGLCPCTYAPTQHTPLHSAHTALHSTHHCTQHTQHDTAHTTALSTPSTTQHSTLTQSQLKHNTITAITVLHALSLQSLTNTLPRRMAATSMHQKYW